MFEGLLLPWQQIYHLAYLFNFRTTPEVSSKLYFVEICQVSEKLWLFNHKRADFWLPNFGFKRSLLSLLNGFLCLLFVFLNRNLRQLIEIKLLLAIHTKWYWVKSIYLIEAVFNSSSQKTVTIIEVLKEF